MADNDALTRALAKVISDPGSVLPRHYYRPGERETEAQWAARAVLVSLPRLGATVDTAPEGEVLEKHMFQPSYTGMVCDAMVMRDGGGDACGQPPDAPVHAPDRRDHAAEALAVARAEVLEADDTVPVERLAHWLHGEFDAGAANSELLPWAQEREEIKDRYRNTAHALMSQLPELFHAQGYEQGYAAAQAAEQEYLDVSDGYKDGEN